MSRRPLLPLLCLLLCGFMPCGDYLRKRQAAQDQKRELLLECKALEERTIAYEEERAFGAAVGVKWVSEGGGLATRGGPKELDRALHQQLNRIGKNLAAQSSRPELPWAFGVLQSEGVNAVSGPGGYVFVSQGLLARLEDEAQLAGVLAHEIAHINRKHALNEYHDFLVAECQNAASAEVRRVDQEAAVSVAQGMIGEASRSLATSVPWSGWQNVLGQVRGLSGFDFDKAGKAFIKTVTDGMFDRLTHQGFRPADEFQADLDAVELMAAAGYSPDAYVAFLAKLPRSGLSTPHPSAEKRQARVSAHLETLLKQNAGPDFTTPVDLSRTVRPPLRDELLARRRGQ